MERITISFTLMLSSEVVTLKGGRRVVLEFSSSIQHWHGDIVVLRPESWRDTTDWLSCLYQMERGEWRPTNQSGVAQGGGRLEGILRPVTKRVDISSC